MPTERSQPEFSRSPLTLTRVLVWRCAALCTVANLLAGVAYALSFHLAAWTNPTDGVIAALDLDGEGSMHAWLSTITLFVAGLLSLALWRFAVRSGSPSSERLCWLGTGATLLVMSLDEGGSMHEAFKEACVRLFGTRLIGDGSIYWVIPYAIALGLCFAALLRSLRHRPLLQAGIVTAAICYAAAAAAQMELFWPTEDVAEIVFEELLEAQGAITLATVAGLHLSSHLRFQVNRPATTRATSTGQVIVIRAGRQPVRTAIAAGEPVAHGSRQSRAA